jgi:nucleoside-diphosphate-sugar epimerase
MTVLITGSNGFLGAALVRRMLAHQRRDFSCFVRPGSDHGRLEQVAREAGGVALQVVEGTLTSVEAAARAIGDHDTIVHLAAAPRGQAADIFLNSVVSSKYLVEASLSRPRPPKIVLVSSFGVYGTANLPEGTLLDEGTALEQQPRLRDVYSQAKLRQELLFREYRTKTDYPLVVLRPGVIYGPSGGRLSARIGVQLPGLFLELGGHNALPLTYVDNCAEAIVVAADQAVAIGETYNVLDDDLPDCHQYFLAYQRQVGPIRSVRVPYAALMLGSRWVEAYHRRSGGQLPDVFTPYKTRSMWKGLRYSNEKLKSLTWRPPVSTAEGMRRTFDYFRRLERDG